MYKLFARPGWGSVLAEAQLAWYGLPFEVEDLGDLFTSEEARQRLATVNPLAQIPTLVLPDGRVMTESAAITLYLADVTGRHDLVPEARAPERPEFLRWLVFMVANIYPTFTYADLPERFVPGVDAQKAFRVNVDTYAQRLWAQMDGAAGQPWFLGARFSAIDIFIAAMTQWRPKRPWFAGACPRLHAIAEGVDALPPLAEVWRRNYPPE
ncbi:glutathione S-transferase family protein [Limobrevibacterium gyesilva]|uniref:Glutathione S-transferase n=1 Tax=Limobrevibacterium gyesilva TaxID=2991712 RepID=A0AA41YIT5_9PROT|nr:glutathione S-transferase [Limobrevibacterium gyesilva]MCW3474404.1 glutathione S-transferase [Limobrevibacterium gyesilva]